VGGATEWRWSFYGPLLVYLAFAVYMLVHTSLTAEIKNAASRRKVLRRMIVIALVFIGMWVLP
jgi:hypothetical protein